MLSTQLRKYNSSRRYYLGHWLSKRGKDPLTVGNFKRFPEAKRASFFYATGPAYCISSALMKDVERYFRGKKLISTCHNMGLTQDVTLGAIIGKSILVACTAVILASNDTKNYVMVKIVYDTVPHAKESAACLYRRRVTCATMVTHACRSVHGDK